MRLYIMRHSETDWNCQKRIQGHSDIQLNKNGIKLAELTGEGMADIPLDFCFTSPLIRARRTAEIILSRNKHFLETGLAPVTDERIREIGFGVWEGLHSARSYGEVNREDFEDFYLDPNGSYCPEGAERLASVIDRSGRFIDEISSDPEFADKTVLVLTHGCTMRCILAGFSDDPEYYRHPHVPFNCEAAIIDKAADGSLVLTDPGSIYYDHSLAVNYYGY